MQQYLDLLQAIKERGTQKPAARENMPGSLSLFGYQYRHDLSAGFPLLTTKELKFKNIITELLWFLRGDTNIKYLVDRGCNIWNEDAYNYYLKRIGNQEKVSYKTFVDIVKSSTEIKETGVYGVSNYNFGDCGKQYGWLWRSLETIDKDAFFNSDNCSDPNLHHGLFYKETEIDQITDLIEGLKKSPQSRRHIIVAWNPSTLDQMALHPCHCLVQFNCRPLTQVERMNIISNEERYNVLQALFNQRNQILDEYNIPKYYLDCQLYQRSADVFLGVPYNIASYALLTHMLAKMCNMIPGDFIHTFGDVHIYDNHTDQVNLQLSRQPKPLPTLTIHPCPQVDWQTAGIDTIVQSIEGFELDTFRLEGYDPHPPIKAPLSTGMKK